MDLDDHAAAGERLPITAVDLFAGCGGFSAGFSRFSQEHPALPPFRTVAAVEFDRAAAATYAANYPEAEVFQDDIVHFDPAPYAGRVEVVTGGPPCQGFSGLGRGNGDDPRNQLWREYLRVVSVVQPKVFVLENVDRFTKTWEFEQLAAASTAAGGALSDYSLSAKTLNAADYGVPQARRRAIVIGTRRDLPPLQHPAATHIDPRRVPSEPALSFGGTAGGWDRRPWDPVQGVFDRSARRRISGTELPAGTAMRRPGHPVAGPYRTTDLHFGRNPTPLSLARYAVIPRGGNRRDLEGRYADIHGVRTYLSTSSWDAHRSGTADVMGRLHADRPSVTIRTEFFKPEKGRYLHPSENRPITHYEAALIQDFPDHYRWHGTKTEIARQIGNAVPVGLSCALAGAIHAHLRGRSRP